MLGLSILLLAALLLGAAVAMRRWLNRSRAFVSTASVAQAYDRWTEDQSWT